MGSTLSYPVFSPIYFGYPYTVNPTWKNLASKSEDGKLQVRLQYTRPMRTIQIQGDGLSSDEMNTITQFWYARKGSGSRFYFEDISPQDTTMPTPTPSSFVNKAILGTGDNSKTYFEFLADYSDGSTTLALPVYFVKSGSVSVYLNSGSGDVLQSSGYTQSIETTSSSDIAGITFNSAIANGTIVKASFNELLQVHFKNDTFESTYNGFNTWSYKLEMEELGAW